VGFIRKLPAHLVASFRATLEEAEDADLLLHVIDASHPSWEDQVGTVEKELRIADFGLRIDKEGPARKPVIHVFNKADLLPDPEAFLAVVREEYPHAILTSANPQSAIRNPQSPQSAIRNPQSDQSAIRNPQLGVASLRFALRTSAQALRPIAEIRVSVSDGKLLASLHRDAEILHQEQTNGVVTITARIEARLLGKLRRDGVEVVLGGTP
jgi:GTP-binding protein HflX